MLTIFTSPRPFVGEFNTIQCNAIRSWAELRPRPQVLLIGNEHGTAAACAELQVQHVPHVRVTGFGTPYADSILEEAERHATHPLLLWMAADTILLDDVIAAARQVSARFDRFCVIAGRHHLANPTPIDFTNPGWQSTLRGAAHGPLLEEVGAGDFFLFPKGLWGRFPPFIEGRHTLDGWMLFRVRQLDAALVDATPSVMSIHQRHGYSIHEGGGDGVAFGPEAMHNRRLAGRRWLTRDNANWLLGPEGLVRPSWSFRRHLASCGHFAAIHPFVGWPLRAYRYVVDRLVLRRITTRVDAHTRAHAFRQGL